MHFFKVNQEKSLHHTHALTLLCLQLINTINLIYKYLDRFILSNISNAVKSQLLPFSWPLFITLILSHFWRLKLTIDSNIYLKLRVHDGQGGHWNEFLKQAASWRCRLEGNWGEAKNTADNAHWHDSLSHKKLSPVNKRTEELRTQTELKRRPFH